MISIIVPAYNACRYLGDAIRSALSQSLTDWELVVVDDGSLDETFAAAREWHGIDARIWAIRQENRGCAAARNTGARASSGSYILFLDHDDQLESSALEGLAGALERAPEAPAAAGYCVLMDENGFLLGSGWPLHYQPLDSRIAHSWLIGQNIITTPGQVLIRREAFDAAGGFREDLHGLTDWDFWLKLSAKEPLARLQEVTLRYRCHPDSMTTSQAGRMDEWFGKFIEVNRWQLKI